MPLEGGPRPYNQEETGRSSVPADLEAAKANFSPDAPENPIIARQRKQEAKAEERKDRRTTAILTAAGLAAAAAIVLGPREAAVTETKLPDNRQTPEQASIMPEVSQLTPSQYAEKALADAKLADETAKKLAKQMQQPEVPETVLTQNFDGLETQTLE